MNIKISFLLLLYRWYHPYNNSHHHNSLNMYTLKGGSFLDSKDGENDYFKLRISTRIGRESSYTAQNIGFRCVQSIGDDEKVKFSQNGYNVFKLRDPIHHHAKKKDSHLVRDKKRHHHNDL
jgi:hypothetical protein